MAEWKDHLANTHVTGVLLGLCLHRILNIESQTYNPASYSRLFQSHHTCALHINKHAQMTGEHSQAFTHRSANRYRIPKMGNLTIYFTQVFQKNHLSGCQTTRTAVGGEERAKDSPWQLLLTETRGEREWNKIENEMTGFSIWQECLQAIGLIAAHSSPTAASTFSLWVPSS